MKYYKMNIGEVFKYLKTRENGLKNEEALKRLKVDGKNKLKENKKDSIIIKFLKEFKDLMIIILLIAALISFIVAIKNQESIFDSIVILGIVVLNAIMGFVQELKADKALESLKKCQVTNVKVKRDNKISIVNSEDIVKGDILVLEAGDKVPADARIIYEKMLKVDESTLTGESKPVCKNSETIKDEVNLAFRYNMLYSGTCIVYGKCTAVVCETGMNTELGLIAQSLNEDIKEVTPLQKKIDSISRFLSIIIALIIFLMFIVGIFKKMAILDTLMLAISLAVAAIPEGLPAIITIILSLGVNCLAKKKAIVRKLSSVDTLGCTEVICSDKTGTITQNKMTVREIIYDNQIHDVNSLQEKEMLLYNMILNNDAVKNDEEYIGDPTEIAIYQCSSNMTNVVDIRTNNPRIDELPFDSNRKMMSTINQNKDKLILYTKGSFDSLIKRCSYVLENNKVLKLTNRKIKELKEMEMNEANKAYRVIAFAYKEISKSYVLNEKIEDDLIFVGMVALVDPPRPLVKEAIRECIQAHIKPIMITGDSLATAIAIAKEVGILKNDDEAIMGEEIDKMTDKELKKNIEKYTVYARVSPLNKLRIVNAWKAKGKIVAMTGDGVNDAPALKAADIGVGMGISGTEVAKNVADIILTDDSFSTIVVAIKEGRRIYDNIRNILVYLLTGNIAEVLIVFIGMLMGKEIFLPIQLLYINLITDSIPAIALAFEKEKDDVMKQDIRKNDSSIFTPFLIAKMSLSALLKTIAILLVYLVNLKIYNIDVAISMAFLTLILLEITFAFSCKDLKNNVISKKIFNNCFMNKSIILLLLLQVSIFISPVKKIFRIVNLSLLQVGYCVIIIVLVFLTDEITKKIIRKTFKD